MKQESVCVFDQETMSYRNQFEILEFLKKHPHSWFSVIEFSKEFNCVGRNMAMKLKKLRDRDMLQYKLVPVIMERGTHKVMFYKHKPRVK